MSLFIVDCEAVGPCPGAGTLTEFGAVHFRSRDAFHGVLHESRPSDENPAVPVITGQAFDAEQVFSDFERWILERVSGRAIFVSDNPAYDFQWINHGFWTTIGRSPFGHSARRIGDFYAGLAGDFYVRQNWKSLRITPHDHNPVNDAFGNAEALERLLAGELP